MTDQINKKSRIINFTLILPPDVLEFFVAYNFPTPALKVNTFQRKVSRILPYIQIFVPFLILQNFFVPLVTLFIYDAWSRDSSVGITTGYGLDSMRRAGVRVSVGERCFFFHTLFIPALGSTQPPI
jgi:hypothetical protein